MRSFDPPRPKTPGSDRTANIHRWPKRTDASREMVSGLVAWCLHLAIKDRAAERKMAVYKLIDEMGIGMSTVNRMRYCKPIAQTTVLKIVTYLGTSVRAVVSKYQQEKK